MTEAMLDQLLKADTARMLTLLGQIEDVGFLRSVLPEVAGDLRRAVEDRIAIVLRRAPDRSGICIDDDPERLPMEWLDCALEEPEAIAVARDANTLIGKLDIEIEKLKDHIKGLKTDHEKQERRRDAAVNRLVEVREVEVMHLLRSADGLHVVLTLRQDTGDEICRRTATDSEVEKFAQLDLFRGSVQ